MKYIVFKSGGKQYRASEGDILEIERINSASEGKELVLNDILLFVSDGITEIGSPLVSGVIVKAKIVGDIKGEKIRVSKYKSKVRYRRVTGHRQSLTQIQIAEISTDKGKKESKPKEENTKETKKTTRSSAKKVEAK